MNSIQSLMIYKVISLANTLVCITDYLASPYQKNSEQSKRKKAVKIIKTMKITTVVTEK